MRHHGRIGRAVPGFWRCVIRQYESPRKFPHMSSGLLARRKHVPGEREKKERDRGAHGQLSFPSPPACWDNARRTSLEVEAGDADLRKRAPSSHVLLAICSSSLARGRRPSRMQAISAGEYTLRTRRPSEVVER
jgi:hypothetical protein